MAGERTGWRGDAAAALALALLLGAARAAGDWAALSALMLPDTDDLLRLQQIRDWLNGQAWGDLAQHRLATGLPMHWSRLADLGPAAIMALLAPAMGGHAAEVAAVVAWPVLLFAGLLYVNARVARMAAGADAGRTAALVTAVAWPATTVFTPGRIDHHGLQLLLLMAGVLAAMRGAYAAVGLLAAASLVVGMELMPIFAVLGAALVVERVVRPDAGPDRHLIQLGGGALAGLGVGRLLFAGSGWDFPACDGFDALSWRAATILAFVPLALGALPLASVRARVGAALALIALAGAAALAASPECASPYGGVSPELRRVWLDNVTEAQSAWTAPGGTLFGHLGLAAAGLLACLLRVARGGGRAWRILLALQIAALAVAATQIRGSYAAVLLAVPALAALVSDARRRGALRLVAAWTASAGLLYPITASAFSPQAPGADAPAPGGDCSSPALLAALRRLPVGTVMAPVDAGASVVAHTGHRVVAAPYHRNGDAILASFRFYEGGREAARVAQAWRADYALACAGWPAAGPALAVMPDGARILRAR